MKHNFVGADVGLHRQRVIAAGKKIIRHWPQINEMLTPILGNLAFYQANACENSSSDLSDDDDDENLPFKGIINGSKKRQSLDDDEGDVDNEDGDHMECEDEEENCAELATVAKCKSTAAPPPKKKGRAALAKKEYIIPGDYFLFVCCC